MVGRESVPEKKKKASKGSDRKLSSKGTGGENSEKELGEVSPDGCGVKRD